MDKLLLPTTKEAKIRLRHRWLCAGEARLLGEKSSDRGVVSCSSGSFEMSGNLANQLMRHVGNAIWVGLSSIAAFAHAHVASITGSTTSREVPMRILAGCGKTEFKIKFWMTT
jgi:hypothetical protein